MDRGFGSFRGNAGPANDRDRYTRDERRYDDFYDSNRRTSIGGNTNNFARRGNQGNWGGNNRDRGFGQGSNRGGNNVGVQMLASLQQQQHLLSAFMNSQNRRGGILQTPRNQGGRFQGNRQNRTPNKRRVEQNPSGVYKKSRPSGNTDNSSRKSTPSKSEKKEEVREPSPEIPDEEVVIPDSLMDAVEKLRQRKDIERNVADEDVLKLLTFSFNGKGYNCTSCSMFLSKEAGFHHHLMGKSHVMTVIESRTAKKYQAVREILDIDLSGDDWFEKSNKAKEILHKQAKQIMKARRDIERRERENYEKTPSNFFTVRMETKKAAKMVDSNVTITSIVESTIEIKEFTKDRFFGCEFVKAVTGFHCRLCNIHIKEASQVIPHVDGRVHRNNYQVHLNKNKDYEKVQKEQNAELCNVLKEHDDKLVMLHETSNADEMPFLSTIDLVRDEKLLNPSEMKKEDETGETDKTKVRTEDKEKKEEKDDNVEAEKDVEKKEVTEEKDDVENDAQGDVDDVEKVEEKEHEQNNGNTEDVVMKSEEVDENSKDKEQQDEEKPAKSNTKKSTPNSARGKSPGNRRGRGRGAKGGTTRSRRSKGKDDSMDEKLENNDASFLDAFEVVDEVVEE